MVSQTTQRPNESLDASLGVADAAAIRHAMIDYAQGWYAGDMQQMGRALHPALAKRAILPSETEGMQLSEYTAAALTARVGKNTPEQFAAAAKLAKTTIFAQMGNAATGQLEMDGWVDFMHLLKVDGQWQIINILWEPKAVGA